VSDVVIVALISAGASIVVALITQIAPVWNGSKAKATGDSLTKLEKENGALKKENNEKQEIIDYYRKRVKK